MVRLPLAQRLTSLSSRNPTPGQSRTPSPSGAAVEKPLLLRVAVLKGRNLAPKDRNGRSDPYLVVTLGDSRQSTPTIQKTLNPEWNVVFEMPVIGVPLLECICWDHDRFGKDYMGEFDIPLEDIFCEGEISQQPIWYTLESKRKPKPVRKKDNMVSGEILLQFSLVDAANPMATAADTYRKFQNVVCFGEEDDEFGQTAPGMGDDDSTDEADENPKTAEVAEKRRRRLRLRRLKRKSLAARAYQFSGAGNSVQGIVFMEIVRITDLPPERNVTRTSFDMDPFVVTSLGRKTLRTPVIRHNLNPVYNEKMVFQVMRHEQTFTMSFSVVDRDKFSGNDFVASAGFPLPTLIHSAPEADPETGLYKFLDPTLDPTGSDESLRAGSATPSIRPSLKSRNSGNSVSAQSLDRPPLKSQNSGNSVSAQSLDRPPLTSQNSGNSVSAQSLDRPPLKSQNSGNSVHDRPPLKSENSGDSAQSVQNRPPPIIVPEDTDAQGVGEHDVADGLVADEPSREGKNSEAFYTEVDPPSFDRHDGHTVAPLDTVGLKEYKIPLTLKHKERWEDKHFPELTVKAKYVPYRALRQQFWRLMLRQYDADDSGRIDKVELTTMLDTLGSTLKETTIDSFFQRFRAQNEPLETMDLSFDQVVICLEDTLQSLQKGPLLKHEHTSSSGSQDSEEPSSSSDELSTTTLPTNLDSEGTAVPTLSTDDQPSSNEDDLHPDDLGDERGEEHVVEIRECPLCHQPRLAKRSDADIITHIATCASRDWRQVDNLVMGGFVTSSQAQRKWYTKVITKISYGGYKLGANSANILVQDRITGQINEERMSVYVRLGIRLLYKGLKSRDMEKKRIRRILRSMSIKQGRKYDDPDSTSQIKDFINFHQLDMSEVLLPLEKFKNFNEFFYRQLKPSARPCSAPEEPGIVVSPADCRSVVFDRIDEATGIWIKGREFSIERLLGDAYPEDAYRYKNAGVGVFRLAPQDYHRFHIPVDGIMGTPKTIEGEYYTVNPMAIRSALDVYGENVRVLVPIDSVVHGRVMVICVGAMMVGSTVITRKPGEKVARGEELGYFKFGGSTLLILFEDSVVSFDSDLVENSRGPLETLIRVGMSVGHSPDVPQFIPDLPKRKDISKEEMQAAKRRIEGSLAPASDPVSFQ